MGMSKKTLMEMKVFVVRVVGILAAGGILVACGAGDKESHADGDGTAEFNKLLQVGYTYYGSSGNRYVSGEGAINQLTPVDLTFSSEVIWVTGVADGAASIWSVVLGNGDVKAFRVADGPATELPISPAHVSSIIIPTLVIDEDRKLSLANVFEDGSIYSGPVIVDMEKGHRVYIAENGDLVLKTQAEQQRLKINALPYSRIVQDEKHRLLVLSKPELRYNHRVLGEQHANAAEITLIQTTPEFRVLNTIPIEAPDVIEGNALIWEDLNGDGVREIVLTLANGAQGARIVALNEDGSLYGESSPIGQGFRWRHQIAVAPFRSSELSLASVYIPHLGPQLEFVGLEAANFPVEKEPVSYSSHLNISLNLDKSLAGDFDGDGIVEVLLLDRSSKNRYAAFEYTAQGISADWTLTLGDVASSNLAAVSLENQSIALAVGQGNSLRVWHPAN